ncbi:hypothetical protein Glove_226g11 [Diversispora epigaea]|uniref:Kinetochore protein SPC25 n=1 Tax=Diversispora epigaea TaxID=1348612 RepID=A0A397IKP3_9GLOM|nr:hypothetical protein Glove_226g11 [Diversispora epigaea]
MQNMYSSIFPETPSRFLSSTSTSYYINNNHNNSSTQYGSKIINNNNNNNNSSSNNNDRGGSETPTNSIINFSFKKVDFNRDEIRQKNKLFEEEFLNYINNAKYNLSVNKQHWQSSLALEKGNITRYSEEIKSVEKKNKELIATLEKEKKELYKIQLEVTNLKNEENLKLERKNSLLRQVEITKKDIQKYRDVLSEKQIALEKQLAQNEPELNRFEDKLAFTMEGVRDDAILFTFKCIYENDSSRKCSFTVDVGEKYSVIECNPPLGQVVCDLLSQLNSTRDFFTFIKKMRQAFLLSEKQIALEKQLAQNEPELNRFEDKLAFTMEGVRDDAILFTFKCIYENDSSRKCSFTVDVGEKYSVIECNPPLGQVVCDLLSQLNSTRDFFTFIKKMRQAFRKNALEETTV